MFRPKGEYPQWRIIFDRLAAMNIGDVVTDIELQELVPDTTMASIRGSFIRAQKTMELDHKRTFDRVRLIGYRMVEAPEHLDLARRHHKKAKRQVAKAIGKAASADRSLLDREARRRIDEIEESLRRQQEMISRLDQRQSKTEKDTVAVNDRLDYVVDLLRRHGITDE